MKAHIGKLRQEYNDRQTEEKDKLKERSLNTSKKDKSKGRHKDIENDPIFAQDIEIEPKDNFSNWHHEDLEDKKYRKKKDKKKKDKHKTHKSDKSKEKRLKKLTKSELPPTDDTILNVSHVSADSTVNL